jgi:hypothetical protein
MAKNKKANPAEMWALVSEMMAALLAARNIMESNSGADSAENKAARAYINAVIAKAEKAGI